MNLRAVLRAALRDEWDGLQRITRDIRPADLVTMLNAIVGLAAIVVAADHTILAAELILVGILLDGLDGAVARLTGGGPLGGFLDSLADIVTFAVAPAVLLATSLDAPLWAVGCVAAFFLACTMLRLARFEALRETKHMAYFSGMSSPGGALVVVAAILAGFSAGLTLAFAVVSALFMVSRIRYPKLRGALGITAVLVILVILGLGRWAPELQATGTLGMVAFMTTYLVFGPFYVLTRFGPTAMPPPPAPHDESE